MKTQSGVVIVVALVMLLVMTGIGITLMSGSTLQERMAGNNRQFALAVANAEAALRRAEEELSEEIVVTDANPNIKSAIASFFINDGKNSRYSDFPIPNDPEPLSPDPLEFDLKKSTSWTDSNSVAAAVTTTSAKLPQYVIEYIGESSPPTVGKAIDASIEKKNKTSSNIYFFQITAIGFGADDDIFAVLQSTYSTGAN